MLHHKGKFGTSAFYPLDLCMSGIPACGYCGQFAFQFSITAYPVFGQEIHGLGGLFQIVQLRPMGEACTLLRLDVVLNINEQADLSVLLFRLAGRSGVSGDPGSKGFFGVVRTQGFQTGEPFLIWRSGGDILAALDLITFPLQAAKQFFQVGTGWQEPVDGRFQLCLIAGAVLRSLMFNIALALVLSGDDDRQTVFLAKPVGGAADIVITPLVGMIVLVIRKADRIENQVVMNMIFVYMGSKYKFILAAQDFFASSMPISWACSGVTSPGSNAWIRWRPRWVPLSMEWRRVQANSISAVSAVQP